MEDNEERVFTFTYNSKMFENLIVNMVIEEMQEWMENATLGEKLKFIDDFFESQQDENIYFT
jgi:hypothetical protein